MSVIHQLQSYCPYSISRQKLGLWSVMLNALPNTPPEFGAWIDGLVFDDTRSVCTEPSEAPRWEVSLRGVKFLVEPRVLTWTTDVLPVLEEPWVEIGLIFAFQGTSTNTLSGFHPRSLPVLEQLAITTHRLLQTKEIFLSSRAGLPSWVAQQCGHEKQLWDFDVAVVSDDSTLLQRSVPWSIENKGMEGFRVLRSKWVSFDLRKGLRADSTAQS